MDRRTKILGGLFGAMIGYALVVQWVYPSWIAPLFSLDERIATVREELNGLERDEERVERAKREYRDFLERIGSLDAGKVNNELRSRLNELISRHGLQNANVSAGHPTRENKTEVERFSVEVSAEAPLQAVIQFLKEVSELPQVFKVGNVRLAKMSGSRAAREADRINLSMPLEVMVLPTQKLLGPVDESKFKAREAVVRHQGRDYSQIWDRRPFIEFEPTRPIVISIKQKTVTAKQGAAASLHATVSGGNGELRYAWSPAEGLSEVVSLSPRVETATPGARVYTLTVTDARGQTASDTATVTVQEPPQAAKEPARPAEPPPPPPKPKDQAWPDGRFMQVNMVMSTFFGSQRVDELMVYNTKSRNSDIYKVGDAFDGGELVFLHQRGGVVRRNDEYFLYPIGINLDGAVEAKDGTAYPELLEAAKRHQEEHPAAGEGSASAGPSTSAPPMLVGPGALTSGSANPAGGEVGGTSDLEQVPPVPAVAPERAGAGAGTPPPVDRSGSRGQVGKRTGRTSGSRTPSRKSAEPGNPADEGGDAKAKSGEKQKEPPEPVPE